MNNMECLDNRTDKERLQDRLEWEGYTEKKMKSDGNCQFRAIADQVYKTAGLHKRVRQEIVEELKSHPNSYKAVICMQFKEYVKNMSVDSVWGDEITLKAAASVYGVKIVVIQSSKHTPSFVVLPKSGREPDKVIHLSYLAGIHFNSIYMKQGTGTGKKNKEKEKEEKEEKDKEKKKEEKKKEKEEKKKEKENKNKREKKNKNKFHRQSHFSYGMSTPLEGEEEEEEEAEAEKLCRQFHLTDFM